VEKPTPYFFRKGDIMIYLLFFLVMFDICLSIKIYRKMFFSFELIFNKLHIDSDIWGGDDNE